MWSAAAEAIDIVYGSIDARLLWNETMFEDDETTGRDVTDATGKTLLSQEKVEMKQTATKGWGVFSNVEFERGAFLFRTVAPFGSVHAEYANKTHMKRYALQFGEVLVCAPLDSRGDPSNDTTDPNFDLYAFINEPTQDETVNVQMHPIYNASGKMACVGVWAIADIWAGDELCVHYGLFERSWPTPTVPILRARPEQVTVRISKPIVNTDANAFVRTP